MASLPAAKAPSCEARVEAPSGANSETTSLKRRAALNSAKALGAQIASPLSSHPARKSTSKAKFRVKPKIFQLIRANVQPSQVSVLDGSNQHKLARIFE